MNVHVYMEGYPKLGHMCTYIYTHYITMVIDNFSYHVYTVYVLIKIDHSDQH